MNIQVISRKIRNSFLWLCGILAPLAWGGVGGGLLTSCTDFDDYNKVEADALTASANQTLWENISKSDNLKDFAALVKAAGFDQELNTTHYYTVWAPLDGTYDAARLRALGNEALLNQFVKNHIAEYSHGATGTIDERILMLNKKSYDFNGTGSYKFDGVAITKSNLPSSNGLLHILDGQAAYYPNIYEYVTDSLLSGDANIDSLRNFYLKYQQSYLDTEASHAGSIVNGMQTYIDSVIVTYNSMWAGLNAYTTQEDSAYTFLLPTNKAWNAAYDRIKSYYNYIATTKGQTFNGTTASEASLTIDPAYWQDSLATSYLVRYLAYSNNDGYNQWLEGTPSYLGSDTLRTTLRAKLSNPRDLLAQAVEKKTMSNGFGYIVDSLAILPWETYCPERFYSASSQSNRARVYQGNAQTVRVDYPDPSKVDVTYRRRGSSSINNGSYNYLWVEPTGGSSKPELNIYLRNVLSTTYDIYCIFVPENVDMTKPNAETRPNRVIFTLNYCDENGKLQNKEFRNETPENEQAVLDAIAQWKEQNPGVSASAPDAKTKAAFSNDVTKVDTVYVGEFTFPVSYYGLSTDNDTYCPNIKISSPFNVFNKALMGIYNRELRIGGFLLVPKELDELENASNNE